MSSLRNGKVQSKGLAVVPGSGNGKPTARGVSPPFDGTIASVCESMGISLEQMIDMMRWAKESDPRVAQLLNSWDALDPFERQAGGTAEVLRQQVGFKLLELLGIVADAACRAAISQAQIIAALSHPRVVAKTVERALTDEGIADRVALHKAMGFLPISKGSQTIITVMQSAQATAAAQPVAAPRPEETIRLLSGRFNAMRGLPRPPAAKDTEPLPVEAPEGAEYDGK